MLENCLGIDYMNRLYEGIKMQVTKRVMNVNGV